MSLRIASILLAALATLEASAQTAPRKRLITSELGGREMGFLQKANEHGVLLMYLVEAVKTKAGSEKTKAVGELFGTTLDKENSKLLQLAADKGVTFAAHTPESLKKLRTTLEPLESSAFDASWLATLTSLARESAANFEAGTKSTDPEIKSFAEEGLALAREKVVVLEKVAK